MTLVLSSLAVLILGAATPLVFSRAPRHSLHLAMLCALIASVLAILAAGDVLIRAASADSCETAWPLPLGMVRLSLDGLSAWFLMTTGLLGVCVSVYTVPYLRPALGQESVPAFCAIYCILLASLIVLICAADSVLFLLSWEAMTLSAFLLVVFHHKGPEVRRGAWIYLIATHLGTALFVLPLFGVFFSRTGTTSFSSFAGAVGPDDRAVLIMLFALGLLGFGTKAGIMPMHVWLPAAHPVAPTPVSALLSGVVVKTGIYGLLRLLTWLPPLPLVCGRILIVVAAISGVMGVLYALAQHELKRLLAYHTVENIGIIALGIGVGILGESTGESGLAVLGYAGALLHVTNHALFKGLLFLSAGAVLHGAGTGDIERFGGLARKTPVNALMFLVGAVAICGLPPLNGFLSEWVIYGSFFRALDHGSGAFAGLQALGLAALALMGGLALACFAKVFGVVFLGEPRDASVPMHPTPRGMKNAMFVLGLSCLLIGVLPGLWIPLVRSATGQLAGVLPAEFASHMASVLAPAVRLSSIAVLLAVIGVGLVGLRRWSLGRAAQRAFPAVPVVATWGCGFARPSSRMQYTASSFASFLVTTFRTLLWPEKRMAAPSGTFPSAGHVETSVADLAEHDLFGPVFRGASRLFGMIRTVSWRGEQEPPRSIGHAPAPRGGPVAACLRAIVTGLHRGSIQVRLSFVVLTLVTLFLFEAISSKGRPGMVEDAHVDSAQGVAR